MTALPCDFSLPLCIPAWPPPRILTGIIYRDPPILPRISPDLHLDPTASYWLWHDDSLLSCTQAHYDSIASSNQILQDPAQIPRPGRRRPPDPAGSRPDPASRCWLGHHDSVHSLSQTRPGSRRIPPGSRCKILPGHYDSVREGSEPCLLLKF